MHVVCCWPGLAECWIRGNSRGLFAAILFSWTVCFVLLATFVWPEWLGTWSLRLAWMIVASIWLFSLVKSHINFSKLMGVPDSKAHDTFETAQQEYLRGNWYEAEAMLLDLLEKYPRDAEAILLLVGVLRHTQRFQPAIRRLDLLESLDTSAPWRFEIAQERKILERLFSQSLVE